MLIFKFFFVFCFLFFVFFFFLFFLFFFCFFCFFLFFVFCFFSCRRLWTVGYWRGINLLLLLLFYKHPLSSLTKKVRKRFGFCIRSHLFSAVTTFPDVALAGGKRNDIEWSYNGMKSSVLIGYYCSWKLPLHVCIRLKRKRYAFNVLKSHSIVGERYQSIRIKS